MGKAVNKKAKRVLLTRQKIQDRKPEGKQSEQTKQTLIEFAKSDGKATRYRGKKRKAAVVVGDDDAPTLSGKTAKKSLGSGVIARKMYKEATATEEEKDAKKKKTKEDTERVRSTIFTSKALGKEERSELMKKEVEHFGYVLNCDDFKADPSAAVLAHIEATLDPMKEAKGRARYNPSSKRKLANEAAKEERAQRSSQKAQIGQLQGFQSQLNRSSPYKSPSGAAKPKPKTSGGRKAGGGMSKPWLQPANLKR